MIQQKKLNLENPSFCHLKKSDKFDFHEYFFDKKIWCQIHFKKRRMLSQLFQMFLMLRTRL
jgi:hypothetical protein